MSLPKSGNGLRLVGFSVVLLAIVVAVNYVSARSFGARLDLTRDGRFTVADATKQILGELDDVVNIKVYFSSDLPEQVATIPASVHDLLAELATHAPENLQIDYIDPDQDGEAQADCERYGIPRVPIRNLRESVEVFLGIAIIAGDKHEAIRIVIDNMNLEHEIMSAILKTTRPRSVVGFLTGHGENDLYGSSTVVAEALRQQYDLVSVSVADGNPIPETVDALIVAGPKRALDSHARYQIDQFLMRGGHAMFLLSTTMVSPADLTGRRLKLELVEQVAHYGVRVGQGLVLDWAMHEVVEVAGPQTGGRSTIYRLPYPLWVKLSSENLAQDHPIMSRLPAMVLPWTAPLTLEAPVEAREVVALARSSQRASVEATLVETNPRSLTEPPADRMKQEIVMAAITGRLDSAFDSAPATESLEPKHREAVPETRILVIGGSAFADDGMIVQQTFSANLIFFRNAVDWLTLGGDLIEMRTRLGRPPMLDPARRDATERLLPWLHVLVMPAVVALLGAGWRLRRKRRRF